MNKKIGIFLMIMLVLWSVLLLDATKNRRPPQPLAQPPVTTEMPTKPSDPATVPPETTIPAAAPTKSPALSRVEEVLARHTVNRTAVTHLVRAETTGDSVTGALAGLAAQREMNPIAAFWLLVSEGLYQRDGAEPGLPPVSLADMPVQNAKQYSYTDEGAAQLLTDLLILAGGMESGMAQAVLGEDGAVDPGQVSWSEPDGCRYAYFADCADGSIRILCFYLREDAQGDWIGDVELQLLHMTGSGDADQADAQTAALAAAVELLMTGTARAGGGETPASYVVGGCEAAAERLFFTADGEQGSLTNYRLKK